MDHRKPLLSGGTHEYFSENEFILKSSSTGDQTEMGLTTSKGNNRIADLSWSFPSLTMDEVLNLKKTYETLAMLSPKDRMINRVTFMHYFKLGKVLGDRFFCLLDKDGDGKINLNEFLGGLAICLHGSFEEKSRLLFKMFDTNGDDYICEEDLNAVLPFIIKACTSGTFFPESIPSSQVNKGLTMDFDEDPANLIRNLFATYDKKQTGKLTLDDFCNWIQAYPSFVHAVFQCDFFINFMSPRYSMESHPDIKESSKYPGLQSQTWMDEEMEVEKIMQVSQEMQLTNARYLWKPCFPTSASAKVPGTRFKHTAIFYQGCVYVLGGRGKQNTYKDLWRYFVDENFWEKIQAEGPGPPALQEHSAVVLENLMYVFGGAVSSDAAIPLWCLNLDKLCWISLRKRRIGPSNRRGHSAVMHYDSMYVFGGFSDTAGSSNELWRFDTERDDWTLIKPQNSRSETIPPRYSHAATVFNNAMWIFGGFESLERKNELWRWDFELSFWSRAKFKQGPPQLSGHSMGKVADSIIVFGGESNSGLSNDLWRYSFENYKWSKVTPYSGIGPPVRSFQAMVVLSPFVLYKKIKTPFQESSTHTVNDFFVRNVNGSKRSLGNKSNSADSILNADKELSAGLRKDNPSSRMGSRPHSVIEQICHNFQEMDTLAPVDVNVGSSMYGTSPKDLTLPLGRKDEGRRKIFQIEEYSTQSSTEESSNYYRRRFWSLTLIGGRGKLSVDMHKTSIDVWECEIGKGSEIPPVNVPDPAEVEQRKYLLPAQKAKVSYNRLQAPESPVRLSKRKLNAYDKLEVTDITDEVCFESSPEQRPKLQETRRLLANR